MGRLTAAARWLHDPAVTSHPRYRAWERRHVLAAVRAGAITLAIVLGLDSVLLLAEAPALWIINGLGAVASLGVFAAVRTSGDARRAPAIGAFVLGAVAVATTLIPIAAIPSAASLMLAYMPIVIIASALFIPWTVRWHLPWLVVVLGSVIAFAASPFAATLTPSGRQELVSVTATAALVSFAGHAILQRERRRTFVQRLQLRSVNQTARRQRRELEALAAQLEQVARRDPLTGIGNRLRLDEDLAAIRAAGALADRVATLILLDIDHFKAYNDENGHLAGDDVLREVARAIAINLRPEDHVYRFGGEEFLVLLDGVDAHRGIEVAERLRQAIQSLWIELDGNRPWGVLTASAGVATVRVGDGRSDDWIRAADERLYAAKAAGRNRVVGPTTSPAGRADHVGSADSSAA